jgi:stage V sporulation protein B
MAQTSVSQIIEQLINALLSIGAAILLINVFVGSLSFGDDAALNTKHSMYGAVGSAIGTGSGVVFALLFMLFIYAVNRPIFHKRLMRDRSPQVDTYQAIIASILRVVTPFILSTAVYQLNAPINISLFRAFFSTSSTESVDLQAQIATNYGVFQNATTISNIPIVFASAMAVTLIPTLTQAIYLRHYKTARRQIHTATKITMLISMPCAVGLVTLAEPIYGFLFRNSDAMVRTLGGNLLRILAISVIFFALSTLTNSCLQGLGKVSAPIRNALIALFVQTIVLVALLWRLQLDIYSLVIVSNLYALLLCVLNFISIHRALGLHSHIFTAFIRPLFASFFMGAMSWATYNGLILLTLPGDIALILAVLVGGICYFIMLLLVRGVSEQELARFPKGHLLVRVAHKLRLLHKNSPL